MRSLATLLTFTSSSRLSFTVGFGYAFLVAIMCFLFGRVTAGMSIWIKTSVWMIFLFWRLLGNCFWKACMLLLKLHFRYYFEANYVLKADKQTISGTLIWRAKRSSNEHAVEMADLDLFLYDIVSLVLLLNPIPDTTSDKLSDTMMRMFLNI